jgi:DNA-binding NarL/FixJ family response regulator
VKSHVGHIFSKLDLGDRAAAIAFAFDHAIDHAFDHAIVEPGAP